MSYSVPVTDLPFRGLPCCTVACPCLCAPGCQEVALCPLFAKSTSKLHPWAQPQVRRSWDVCRKGSVSRERAGVEKEGLYAKVGGRNKFPGWCNANPKDIMESAKGANEARLLCSCDYDGAAGLFCHIPVQSFCVNQCSGRGTCIHGHCQVGGQIASGLGQQGLLCSSAFWVSSTDCSAAACLGHLI